MARTGFYENSKVFSTNLSVMENIVAPLSCPSIFPIKVICCFESGSPDSICLLKSIAINL